MSKLTGERLPIESFVLRNIAEGGIIADEQGSIINTNPASDRIYGYDRGEIAGRDVSILFPDFDSDENGLLHQILPEL